MTEKQRRFADEYLLDCNATQAAIRAGYSPKAAKSVGQRMLTYADVKTHIDEELQRLHDEKIADATEVMIYLTTVMRGESKAEVIVVEDGTARGMDKAPDEKERLKAAELLGKRHGLWRENVNLAGIVPVVIVDDIPPEDTD